MSDPFIGEIRAFGFNYAPRGWVKCDGQLLPISQNTALFSILGTNFGGDGRTTFGVPNLQGRAPLHTGNSTGPGLTRRRLGQQGGAPTKTVTETNMPTHSHNFMVVDGDASAKAPSADTMLAKAYHNIGRENKRSKAMYVAYDSGTAVLSNPDAVAHTGVDDIIDNHQAFQVQNYCLATEGTYPARS